METADLMGDWGFVFSVRRNAEGFLGGGRRLVLSCRTGHLFTLGVLTQLTICEKVTRKRKFRSMSLNKKKQKV
ncbi:MAG: hypothetical protein FWE28_09935, partial [Oscillospiraceae bacterium]|nr:hypothetical protein [Oscillospiraceae bacterium]